ncbi:RrF2 family transcriptional regulator [Acidaminobacter hydrogenoformans]|uniref:Transcriptional regulator, BadM/Rrf2 family n=1 Tax=Acidaminobacter hydrogenoformans DSM 2784 TaxID=1120920 RepID=A0A1G5S821_9FIRM|nr:Rrf2 family transcriptional regulator [Acidaminobacter hydrogenoformans]SCZ81769.1 transcriptional regulator, BadM/Rrf2 family [Acidaminobacter hydrogenoformans DSM 2784]
MKLSTRGRYGLKAMFDLALNDGDAPISLTSIAERQGISVNYLEQLIAPLKKADLVKSVRGAQGGYLLNKPADQITVADILIVLEGPLGPTECVRLLGDDACEQADYCVTHMIYEKMRDSLLQVVTTITLKDMVLDHKRMHAGPIDTQFFCNK